MPIQWSEGSIVRQQDSEHAFIRSVEFRLNWQWVLVICRFVPDRYQPSMFTAMKIDMPASIRSADSKRQAEFLAGRYAAQQGLKSMQQAGASISQIPIGAGRDPQWPAGIRGSISHSGDRVCCLLSQSASVKFLGVDLEKIFSVELAQKIGYEIHTAAEQQLLCKAGLSPAQASSVIFSAKECLFKALYPYAKEFFGFEAASVVEATTSFVSLGLSPDLVWLWGVPEQFTVHYQLHHDYLFTSLIG
ncbi:4'-phosphopantetheinyl transferase [Rheinheimera marina]|uniref:Enterobactin synthase component D n=1 Tax=Rheinheimera marina TaxID=1774958 RepID=A0ABV9JIM0_9GAMM